jgi:hypothetical protein
MSRSADPELCDINLANNLDTLLASSKNYTDLANLYPGEIETSMSHDSAKQDKLNSLPSFFEGLNNTDLDTFNEPFKLYWLEKFWAAHEEVKLDVHKLLGSSNQYYVNFSESIGSITNIEFIKNNTAMSWYDLTNEADGSNIEYTIPSSSYYKMSDNAILTNFFLSKLTNIVLKTNVRNIIDNIQPGDEQTNISAHGCNLIADEQYHERLTEIIDTIKDPIKNSLKGLYDVFMYLKQEINTKYINPLKIDVDVEGLNQALTILKNKINIKPTEVESKTILE